MTQARVSFRLLAALAATLLAVAAHAAVAPRHLYTLEQQVVRAPENHFGASLATDDVHVLVGSPLAEDSVGSAQLFRADNGSFARVLLDPDGATMDRSFGTGVALVAGMAAVGASGQGVVHLFDASSGALLRSISSPEPGVAGFGARLASAVLHTLINPVAGGSGLGGAIAAAGA